MRKQIKIITILLILTSIVYSYQPVTTGDLLMELKNSDDWPPLILLRPDLPYSFCSEYFKIHYDTAGIYQVYHPHEDNNPADGTPDYINRMAEFLELSRYTYNVQLGYDLPPPDEGSGGSDHYDIYVTNITGLTVPEFPSDYYPDRQAYASYIYIGNDLRNLTFPDDPIPNLKAICSHEFFHAVQMAYRAYTSDETPWWYELTACWAEERVFDDLNIVYNYIDEYYNKIDHSIYFTGGSHMYGAWVFAEYLSQKHSNDIINSIFQKLIHLDNSLIAIRETFFELGLNLNYEFSVFSGWNYFTSHNHKTGFFEEGEDFPVTVPLVAYHSFYPTDWVYTPIAIENMGIAYMYFENSSSDKANLIIEFKADDSYPEWLTLGAIYLSQPVEIIVESLEPDQLITLRVQDFNECEGVILSVNWPFQGYTSTDTACYQYRAYLDSTSIDITVSEPNQPDNFRLLDSYPNPFNMSCNIIFNWNSKPNDYTINIYNIGGRLVERINGVAMTGLNEVVWTPKSRMTSGLYYYRLIIGERQASAKMLLLK